MFIIFKCKINDYYDSIQYDLNIGYYTIFEIPNSFQINILDNILINAIIYPKSEDDIEYEYDKNKYPFDYKFKKFLNSLLNNEFDLFNTYETCTEFSCCSDGCPKQLLYLYKVVKLNKNLDLEQNKYTVIHKIDKLGVFTTTRNGNLIETYEKEYNHKYTEEY